jgi:hypothetical protein
MKLKLTVIAVFVLFLFTGATVWEGAAAVAPTGGLGETGFFVATNSFPYNTAVEITNLENGKTTRAVVVSGLDTPGLLAIVSPDTAQMINLAAGSIGKIRLSQAPDSAARPPDIITDRDKAVSANSQTGGGYAPEIEWADDREIIDLPEYIQPRTDSSKNTVTEHIPAPINSETNSETPRERVEIILVSAAPPNQIPEQYIIAGIPPAEPVYTVVEIDPPADVVIDESQVISPEQVALTNEEVMERYIDESDIIGPSVVSLTDTTEEFLIDDSVDYFNVPPALSPVSVPHADSLDQRKYYIQIGVFASTELVETEVSRVGGNYPLVVQNAGSNDRPLFRVLLGPFNQGESGAVLQRMKYSGYADAFIRRN